jgi:tetratricopeptide (TPR) repeat protein
LLDAGRKLGVDALLEGTIQRSGDKIRVTVQLVRAKDGTPLWADTFHEQFTNIFVLQDSISGQMAKALTMKLTGEEEKQLAKDYTDNPGAYQAYLKGRYFWNKRTSNGLEMAVKSFTQATELDPAFALAYAGLADCYNLLAYYSKAPPKESFPKAKSMAIRALEIDDALAEAHTSLGYVKMRHDWDWMGAEREFKRAIELKSNYATAHHWYSEFLTMMGRFDEAITEAKRARELDALSLIINTDLGRTLIWARQYDEAIEQLEKTLELDPNFAEAHNILGRAYEQKGMKDEAISEWLRAMTLSGKSQERIEALRNAYGVSGMGGYLQNQLDFLLKEPSNPRNVSLFSIAFLYTRLGNKKEALEWLEKAFEERSEKLIILKVDQNFDSLRSDPRFKELLRRVGLAS